MLMIHIGILPDELPTLEAQIDRIANAHEMVLVPITDNDRWSEWKTPAEDGEPIHVTLSTITPSTSLNFIAQHFASFLNFANDESKWPGLRMALTDGANWDEEYEEFRW